MSRFQNGMQTIGDFASDVGAAAGFAAPSLLGRPVLSLGRVKVPMTREQALMAGARITPTSTVTGAMREQGTPLPPPSPIVEFVQGPAAPVEEGIPRAVLIGGGVVGVLALAAVAYKLTRR